MNRLIKEKLIGTTIAISQPSTQETMMILWTLLTACTEDNIEEPIFLIGTDGDGWAFAEWCNLIDEDFDHYDYWHC